MIKDLIEGFSLGLMAVGTIVFISLPNPFANPTLIGNRAIGLITVGFVIQNFILWSRICKLQNELEKYNK